MKDIPGAEISVRETSSMGMMTSSGNPVSISIKGSDLKVLEEISNEFKTIIESVEGTREVKTSLSEAVPEVEVLVNKDNAAVYGLSAAQVASAVKGAASGTTVTKYKDNGEEIDVVIRALGNVTENLSNFEQIDITTPTGVNIPLSQVADLSIQKGPVQINRESQERVVSVTSQIVGRDLGSITSDIEKELQEGENIIEFTPTHSKPINYSCWMGMIGGSIEVVDVLEKGENWLKIKSSSGLTGWVSNAYVTSNLSETTQAPSRSQGREAVVELAYKQLGKSYVWGAEGPNTFDCSGLTLYVYKNAMGKTLPRTSAAQSQYGQYVSKSQLQPGDLVFSDTDHNGSVNHVGIYIGNGKMIHAPRTGDVVKISDINSGYYKNAYVTSRRP